MVKPVLKQSHKLAKKVLRQYPKVDFILDYLVFFWRHGFLPDVKKPSTFTEKIFWIKHHENIERFSKFVDKFEVREFVKVRIGERHLIPLIGVYERSQDIDFNALPTSFIIKATHASGWNLIVQNKSLLDWAEVSKKVDNWVSSSYYELTGEKNYKPISGRVVVEELIKDSSGDLKDYKFFCYNGEPRFIQLDGDRYSHHKRDVYDLEWNRVDVKFHFDNFDYPAKKPELLNEMIDAARALADGFPFVRIDLYCANDNKIYFGEMTFTPGNGLEKFTPKDVDYQFGQHLDLTIYNASNF